MNRQFNSKTCRKIGIYLIGTLFLGFNLNTSAKEIIGKNGSFDPPARLGKMAAGCIAATAQVDLNINNVRTTILNGGDMWWNLNNARYEIPKVTDLNGVRKHSLFAGALWIGGLSQGNLKLAAQTYRQSGSDFWPGPLNTNNASIPTERCERYDEIYPVTREEIESFRSSADKSNPPKSILDWPGNGDPSYSETFSLAPYVDFDGVPGYQPFSGDYPKVFGDQCLWFVYNDRGNIHSETGGVPIGLELQTQAFAFVTNDEVNNMTFYTTTIINRSSESVDSTYFGQWVDPDLGNYIDDYVGCDVPRSLGICYNGDNDDEGILGYGLNPPSVGVDFFRGPKNEFGNSIPLTKFVYYNNDFSVTGNPQRPEHFYGYLRGFWKDNQPITYGGNGRGGSDTASYMFPGTTDPAGRARWDELTAGNTPADRRFIQSAGPFRLTPGAVNEVTVGVVWAKASTGGATGSLELLKAASDKAQDLFDNNFDIIDGPRSPDVTIVEGNQELILNLLNTTDIRTEPYMDTVVSKGIPVIYRFQGYQIYQLKSATVTTGELNDVDQARLIAQFDVQDDITQLVNKEFDPTVNQDIPVLKVFGANQGISHSIRITDDAFASGNKRLVNFKRYHFLIVAYAHAEADNRINYLPGRLNVKVNTGIPHNPIPNANGGDINSKYGTGPKIKRIEGTGNGGQVLEFSQETIDEILRSGFAKNPSYLGGKGPINVKVVDPLKVPATDFELFIVDTSNIDNNDSLGATKTYWYLVNKTTNDTAYSDANISVNNEQIIRNVNRFGRAKVVNWGISVTIAQSIKPGTATDRNDGSNGYIESSFEWSDDSKQWLNGISDADGVGFTNWIRSGNAGRADGFDNQAYAHDFANASNEPLDPREQYEKVLDRKVAPYRLASGALRSPTTAETTFGPAWFQARGDAKLENLASIDLVLTPDKSKWSTCVVVELGEDRAQNEGNMEKMNMRWHDSWLGDIDGNGNPIYSSSEKGRSKFPGYAYNIETGERLNLMFGEDSHLPGENGSDMIWNPTSNIVNPVNSELLIGGKHYIYIMGHDTFRAANGSTLYNGVKYDEGKEYQTLLTPEAGAGSNPNGNNKRFVYSQPMWVMMSYLQPGFQLKSLKDGLVPYEVKLRIRIKRPYAQQPIADQAPINKNMPYYAFNTRDIAVSANPNAGKRIIDLINVVPNPYYAHSGYETNQLDTRVKFTNLPKSVTITIYTLSGTLVRRLKKDDEQTFLDWDIKNTANVPVASGVYIVHIDAGEHGEKVLKWFGVLRPVDLNTF